jgi:hypothetical protein
MGWDPFRKRLSRFSERKVSYNLNRSCKDEERYKRILHSGVEERYLGRLITSRPRFDSGPRNKYRKNPDFLGVFHTCCGAREPTVWLLVGIEQRNDVALPRRIMRIMG